MSLREIVQFMCEMKIKMNTQRIHTVKKNHIETKDHLLFRII